MIEPEVFQEKDLKLDNPIKKGPIFFHEKCIFRAYGSFGVKQIRKNNFSNKWLDLHRLTLDQYPCNYNRFATLFIDIAHVSQLIQ